MLDCLNELIDLYEIYGDDRYIPNKLLKDKVNEKTVFFA